MRIFDRPHRLKALDLLCDHRRVFGARELRHD